MSEEPAAEAPMDFDLNVLDQSAAAPAPARGFDLDDLLARARSEAPEMTAASRRERSAAAVATPPAEDVFRMVAETPVVASPVSVPAPAVLPAPVQVRSSAREPEPAPLTSELPLFMQVMSEAAAPKTAPVRVESPVATLEMAVEALAVAEAEVPAPVVEEMDDRPLVQVPAVPRAPLAVRRTTPDPARLRAKYARATPKPESQPAGDLLRAIDMDEAEPIPSVQPALTASRLSAEPTPESLPAGWLQGVSVGKRVSAAAMDAVLMLGLNAAIVWFTLAICGIPAAQARLLPLITGRTWPRPAP